MDTVRQAVVDSFLHSTVYPSLMQDTQTLGAAISVLKTGGRQSYAFSRAFGFESSEEEECTPATKFNLGRCAKLLAAVVALQLCHERGIPLFSDIKQLLPQQLKVETQAFGAVTVHHLLCHTSGLVRRVADQHLPPRTPPKGGPPTPRKDPGRRGSSTDPDGFPSVALPPPQSPRFSSKPQPSPATESSDVMAYLSDPEFSLQCTHPPGTTYRSNDLDYMLVGGIIEHQTQQRYHTYVQERFLSKLGIRSGGAGGAGGSSATATCPCQAPAKLLPTSGLLLHANQLLRLLQALLPKPKPAAPARPGRPGDEARDEPDLDLAPEVLSKLFQIQFVDMHQDLHVSYSLTASGLANSGPGCLTLETHLPSSSKGAGLGAGCGCQAMLCFVPESGLAVAVLSSSGGDKQQQQLLGRPAAEATAAAAASRRRSSGSATGEHDMEHTTALGHATASGKHHPFCQQVVLRFLDHFRPSEISGPLSRAWLLNLQPLRHDAVLHLICFPASGASATIMYEAWASLLPDHIRVRMLHPVVAAASLLPAAWCVCVCAHVCV